jgi:peptidoglycan/xylan/chitin deacetylase (PgdA/CDA1 family)
MNAKIILRNAAARLFSVTKLTHPGRRSRGKFSIATFHRVLPEAERKKYPFPGLVVTPAELDSFLTYFKQHFDCGTLATQHQRFRRGEALPRPLLAVTFDDGQHDNHRHAAPVLARHGVKASFFIPVLAVERKELLWHDRLGFATQTLLSRNESGREQLKLVLAAAGLTAAGAGNILDHTVQAAKGLALDARLELVNALAKASGNDPEPEFARLMTFAEISDLAAAGHEIGSHSMTHCLMPECDDPSLSYELEESRRTLEARLALPIESFCYPNGNCDARTAGAVEKAGYRRAITTAWGNNGPDSDAFRLRRFDMVARHVSDAEGRISSDLLAFRTSGLYPGLR